MLSKRSLLEKIQTTCAKRFLMKREVYAPPKIIIEKRFPRVEFLLSLEDFGVQLVWDGSPNHRIKMFVMWLWKLPLLVWG
jgi:hypothetical protein